MCFHNTVTAALKELQMNTSQRHTFGWVIGSWLVTLQIERVERTAAVTPNTDETLIDWDALAEQYGVPICPAGDSSSDGPDGCSSDGSCDGPNGGSSDGLQLCAGCGQSVAPGTGRFGHRITLGNFISRVSDGYPYPAGAYLCHGCGTRPKPDTASPVTRQ
jgi:hypothetical protein